MPTLCLGAPDESQRGCIAHAHRTENRPPHPRCRRPHTGVEALVVCAARAGRVAIPPGHRRTRGVDDPARVPAGRDLRRARPPACPGDRPVHPLWAHGRRLDSHPASAVGSVRALAMARGVLRHLVGRRPLDDRRRHGARGRPNQPPAAARVHPARLHRHLIPGGVGGGRHRPHGAHADRARDRVRGTGSNHADHRDRVCGDRVDGLSRSSQPRSPRPCAQRQRAPTRRGAGDRAHGFVGVALGHRPTRGLRRAAPHLRRPDERR